MISRTQNKMFVDDESISVEMRKTIRIWMADDSISLRTLLAGLIEEQGGMDCSRQFGSAEAVISALANETPPDVILLDVRMPGMGGLEAIRPIKSLAPSVHVVMLTTFHNPGTKQQALRNGASALLLKRQSYIDIAAEIRRIVQRSPALPVVDLMAETRLQIGSNETLSAELSNRRGLNEMRTNFSVGQRFIRSAASLRQRVLQTFQRTVESQPAMQSHTAAE